MLFVRSFRSDRRHVTCVLMRRVVTKRLDGLNSRAVRPIPAAAFIWSGIVALQGWKQSGRPKKQAENVNFDLDLLRESPGMACLKRTRRLVIKGN